MKLHTTSVIGAKSIQQSINDRKEKSLSIWEPPFYCRRQIHQGINSNTDYTRFFPLELSSYEYFLKSMNLISQILKYAIDFVCHDIEAMDNFQAQYEEKSSSTSFRVEERVGFDSLIESIFFIEKIFDRVVFARLVKFSAIHCDRVSRSKYAMTFEVAIEIILNTYKDISIKTNKSGKIDVELLQSAIAASSNLVESLLVHSTAIPEKNETPPSKARNHGPYSEQHSLSLAVSFTMKELGELDMQIKLHAKFQSQRMQAIGWIYDEDKELHAKHSVGLDSRILDCKKQLDSLVDSKTFHFIALHCRLLTLSSDIYLLMQSVNNDEGDYSEGQRLRELAVAIEETVDSRARHFLDEVSNSLNAATTLREEVWKCRSASAESNDIANAQRLNNYAIGLSIQIQKLQETLEKFSIIDDKGFIERYTQEGSTSFIDANFIFTFTTAVANNNNHSIASLIINSSAHSVLDVIIAKWPHFSILNDSSHSPVFTQSFRTAAGESQSQSEQQNSFFFSSTENHDYGHDYNNNNNSANMIADDLNISYSLNKPFSSSFSHSPSPLSKTYGANSNIKPYEKHFSSNSNSFLRSNSNSNIGSNNARTISSSASVDFAASTEDHHYSTNNNQTLSKQRMDSSISRNSLNNGNIDENIYYSSTQNISQTSQSLFATSSGSFNDFSHFTPHVKGNPAIAAAVAMCQKLQELVTESSAAHSMLIQRLQGYANDLNTLSDICSKAGTIQEAERLRNLMECVRHTLDCDLNDANVFCGRSVMRIDLIESVLQESKSLQQELKITSDKAKQCKDYSIVTATEKVFKLISQISEKVFSTLKSFTLFDRIDGVENIEERLNTDGTFFIDSDYLMQVECGPELRSLSSLAITASASVILNDIRKNWPNLTTFGANSKILAGGVGSSGGEIENSVLDFNNPASLRKLGFAPDILKSAGFSDVEIISSGYSVNELRSAGFKATDMETSVGINPTLFHAMGMTTQMQNSFLDSFFKETCGNGWNNHTGWKVSPSPVSGFGSTARGGNTSSSVIRSTNLSKVFGASFDGDEKILSRLVLPRNNLKGSIPASVITMVTLTQLILNGNNLEGQIPDGIGLLVNLTSLMLNDNRLSGPIPTGIKSLQALIILRLDNNRLTGGIPQALGELNRLRRLTINNNKIEGKIPMRLSKMTSLQELIANNNQLSGSIPDSLGFLVSLNTVNLQCNLLSGAIPPSFAGLSNLTCLNLQGNKAITFDRIQVQKMLPKCRIVFP